MADYLIAGLGNPGSEHADQRHNIGFWLINRLARRHNLELKNSSLASSATGRIGDFEVVLLKPRTYVNRSGEAVAAFMSRAGVPVERVIVVYDELDLPEGVLRLRPSGSDGGHNGLKSIIAATGSGNFGRIRIGIGRPKLNGVPTWDPEAVRRYVLAKPSRESQEALDAAVQLACDAIETIMAEGWPRAMNQYNTRPGPEEPGPQEPSA